jgi:uridine kinase
MKINRLVLIRGLPGSGKTTYAKNYFNGHIHLEADMYFIESDGFYNWTAERLGKAHSWCFETTKIMLNNGYDVVVSNTFWPHLLKICSLKSVINIPLIKNKSLMPSLFRVKTLGAYNLGWVDTHAIFDSLVMLVSAAL